MPERPGQPEQVGLDGAVSVHDSSLIFAVGVGLVRHQESRPGYDAAGSGRQGRAGVGGVRDSAGDEHRAVAGRGQSMREEVQSRHRSDEVAAALSPLSDQTISAPGDSTARLCLGTDHHEDEDPGIAQLLDKPAILAECKHDDIYPSVDAYRDVAATHEGQQQIYGDRAARNLRTHLIDRGS
jgi:hypothetical protein